MLEDVFASLFHTHRSLDWLTYGSDVQNQITYVPLGSRKYLKAKTNQKKTICKQKRNMRRGNLVKNVMVHEEASCY